ncbi:MAG: thioester domain-containing protein, partial [Candidatus Bathyarchaeia archaeon]
LVNSGSGQNMIVAESDTLTVKPEVELELDIEAYCLDLHKENPSTEETFTIQTDPGVYGEDVINLMKSLEGVPISQRSYDAVQIALWVITDDVSREDIRIFFSEQDIDDAKWLLEKAGIDTAGKKLFQ